MKRTLSLLFLILLGLALSISFFGCDGGETPSPEVPEEPAVPSVDPEKIDLKGIRFSDMSFYYNGEPHSIEIRGTLPQGVRVKYESNGQINAGEYTVTARFYVGDTYLEGKDKSATLTVKKAGFSMSSIIPEKTVFAYDGTPHSIILTNLPRGLTPIYEGNGAVEVGEYTVKIRFEYDMENYEYVPPMYVTLTVTPGEYTEEGLEYTLLEVGSYEITSYNGNGDYIVIPPTYEGKRVTSIGNYAFANNERISYVYMPDSIVNIGTGAFSGCTALSKLVISQKLLTLGALAFEDTALTRLSLPDSLTAIGKGALSDTPLESLKIPFVGGSKDSPNGYFAYLFGAMGYVDGKDRVPESLKTVIISGNAAAVPEYSFRDLSSLSEIILEKGITELGNGAFFGCLSLRDVYISDSVCHIYANANYYDSPFFGCNSELMIVLEGSESQSFGSYWANLTESERARVIYMKSYEDYKENKDSYRTSDDSSARVLGISIGGKEIEGFSQSKTAYQYDLDVNDTLPRIKAVTYSATAITELIPPSGKNGWVATLKVKSQDGSDSSCYTVEFRLIGEFKAKAEVTNKDGTDGTVTYVIDDGVIESAENAVDFQSKYDNLKFTFAVPTYKFAELLTVTDADTGKLVYLMKDGRYTYERHEAVIESWIALIKGENGKYNEIASHSHTTAYWGYHNMGGEISYLNSKDVDKAQVITETFPVGSITKEIYASKQILKDIFGEYEGQFGLSMINPGIASNRNDETKDGVLYPTCYTEYYRLLELAIENGDYIGSRNTFGSITEENAKNYVLTASKLKDKNKRRHTPSFMIYSSDRSNGANSTFEDWKLYIDTALEVGGWATFCLHNVCNTGKYYNLDEEYADMLFSYTDKENIWVASYTEALMYYSQWSTASAFAEFIDGRIYVNLTDGEDDGVFTAALTVKVTVPDSWTEARIGDKTLSIMTDEGGERYVYADIVPDSGEVIISGN